MVPQVGFYFPVQSFNFLAKKSVIMQWMHYKLIYHLDFIQTLFAFFIKSLANNLLSLQMD